MEIVFDIVFLLFILYGVFFLGVWLGWIKYFLKSKVVNNELLNFSVIIPFRNEEENIQKLINSLKNIQYPGEKVEFIFIDDHSEDHSFRKLEETLEEFPFLYTILQLPEGKEGKKRAVDLGIQLAKNEIIITTDADCLYSEDWINEINKSFLPEIDFVIAPVLTISVSSLAGKLQEIESLMLTAITIGSAELGNPLMCSGANLAFRKKLYLEMNPYEDNYTIPSGDDMFFLQKLKKQKRVRIISQPHKEAVVKTQPAKSLNQMLSRAVRWAGKSSDLKSWELNFFGAIVLISNYSFIFLSLLCFFYFEEINIFLKLCGLKVVIDLLTYFLVSFYYHRYTSILFLPIMVLYYPLFLILVSMAMLSTKPKWKNR